ncbi:MAG: hypothetical protein AABY22_17695 [Nanoarchaeota archaeon]
MNLLEFAKETVKAMESISSKNFASYFVKRKSEYFHAYSNGWVTSSSHGISFFENVIKFWDDPDSYYTPTEKNLNKIGTDDYEYNFIRILKHNQKC